jgi:hypothetical protein
MKLLAANAAVCATLAALILAGVELWLRLTVPPNSEEAIFEYTLDNPRYKLMKRNASAVAWGREFRTNDLGFRDEAATVPPKQPGEFRIIVLGDSFTVSAGVGYRDIYTTLLQERLRRTYPQVRVVNLAVSGYNPVQYALVLQEVGLSLQPDMVLIGLFPDNDFSNATYDLNFRVASGEAPARPPQPWYAELYVYRAYLGRVQARLQRMLSGKAPRAAAAGEETPDGWNMNVAALQAISDIARREKLPLAVAMLPHTWHFDRQRGLFGRVERMCAQHGLGCVNLLEPFIARRIDESTLRLNRLDAHPNERYNAVVAEELSVYLAAVLGVSNAGDAPQSASFSRAPARSSQ